MTAPAHLTTATGPKRATANDGVQTRVPWWALVLPALGFALLLVLLVGGGRADAAQPAAAESPVLTFLAEVRDALLS